MYYSGFADEACSSIDDQIKITKELGWNNIESRGIDGTTLAEMDEKSFEILEQKLSESNVKIDCYGSAVANWSKDPRKEEDYLKSKKELLSVLPRMKRLKIHLLRGMSFVIVKDDPRGPDNPEIEKEVFKKVKEFVIICADYDVVYLHENCQNYGGLSWKHTLRLIEAVNRENFRLVFDTGNPVMSYDWSVPSLKKRQSSWEFYEKVKDFVDRVHIKDGIFVKDTDGVFPEVKFTFPGEGDGDVERIVEDLLKRNFTGALSIEPHMAVVHHENSKKSDNEIRYENYLEYGRRLMNMVENLKKKINAGK